MITTDSIRDRESSGAELPSLNSHGLLDPGMHHLSLSAIGDLFGRFQRSEQRLKLFKRLQELVEELGSLPFSLRLIIDGSFITAKDEPSDIDIIFVVREGTFPLTSDVAPFQYNALSSRMLRRKYGFDVLVVDEGSERFSRYVNYFSRLKEGPPEVKKGLVRLDLP